VVVLSQCNKEMSVGHSNFRTSWPYFQRPDGVCNVPLIYLLGTSKGSHG
jgi:hypothetical protein